MELEPYKDRLFGYPATLSREMNGAYRVVDYREMRISMGAMRSPKGG
jgi:hypothetical protein